MLRYVEIASWLYAEIKEQRANGAGKLRKERRAGQRRRDTRPTVDVERRRTKETATRIATAETLEATTAARADGGTDKDISRVRCTDWNDDCRKRRRHGTDGLLRGLMLTRADWTLHGATVAASAHAPVPARGRDAFRLHRGFETSWCRSYRRCRCEKQLEDIVSPSQLAVFLSASNSQCHAAKRVQGFSPAVCFTQNPAYADSIRGARGVGHFETRSLCTVVLACTTPLVVQKSHSISMAITAEYTYLSAAHSRLLPKRTPGQLGRRKAAGHKVMSERT